MIMINEGVEFNSVPGMMLEALPEKLGRLRMWKRPRSLARQAEKGERVAKSTPQTDLTRTAGPTAREWPLQPAVCAASCPDRSRSPGSRTAEWLRHLARRECAAAT